MKYDFAHVATAEGVALNLGNGGRDCEFFDLSTLQVEEFGTRKGVGRSVAECDVAPRFKACYVYARKFRTFAECPLANGCHRRCNTHIRYLGTTFEGVAADIGDAVG